MQVLYKQKNVSQYLHDDEKHLETFPLVVQLIFRGSFVFALSLQPSRQQERSSFAVITGATGRTGQMVSALLLDRGFGLRVLARDVEKAQTVLAPIVDQHKEPDAIVDFCPCDLGNAVSVQEAFAKSIGAAQSSKNIQSRLPTWSSVREVT